MYTNISEEELKAKVALDFFNHKTFDSYRIFGRIDFCVSFKESSVFQKINFLWAQAKRDKSDIFASFVQLILTLGKERTFDFELPPLFLGAFDCEKIAFLPYHKISDIFNLNDFNWNVMPSNYSTNEFKILYQKINSISKENNCIFYFEKDEKILKEFIVNNFKIDNQNLARISVNKDNFKHVYYRWMEEVAPFIQIDWEAEKQDILSADFFLADLLSKNNQTLKKTLRILLQNDFYQVKLEKRKISNSFIFTDFQFKDQGQAHQHFWNIFERPPDEQYWDYILERRDYLVPMDVRERKGAFFTPQKWVVKAQEYLAQNVLNWEDFYIWDCAAGTGNLLRGLPQKPFQIYASTLDKADVEIMKDYYAKTGALLENNIFEFDFLNDDFSKLPESLQKIIKNEPEKLIIFINPPYAEAASTPKGVAGKNKTNVSNTNKTHAKYQTELKKSIRELFAQFFIRIYKEIPNCILGSFSTLKYVNSSNFVDFRNVFKAKYIKGFICPAYTFDNVKGEFPIGFLIWNLKEKESFRKIKTDIFDENENLIGEKIFYAENQKEKNLNQWLKNFLSQNRENELCAICTVGLDFQGAKFCNIDFWNCIKGVGNAKGISKFSINKDNLIPVFVYFSVRRVIPHSWINHNDQFLYPNEKWLKDKEFQNNCFVFALFHNKNRISSKEGVNHFIPFEESEIKAKEPFQSHFLNDFINGKVKNENHQNDLMNKSSDFIPKEKMIFSKEAQEVLDNGKELFTFYHSQILSDPNKPYQPNASFYDIKEFFQGRNTKNKMNPPTKCENKEYKILLKNLNKSLKNLGDKIIPKIFEYGFLKE